jgi:subtilisin family serine protease
MKIKSDHKRVRRSYLPLVAVVLVAFISDFGQQSFAQVFPNDPEFPKQYGLHNFGQMTGGAPESQILGVPDHDIDAPEGWNLKTDASDIIVAIMDFGVNYNHPDLAANIWTNAGEIPGNGIDDDHNGYVDDIHGWDFISNDGDPIGEGLNSEHGTASAGIIGALGNNGIGISGVAWKVKLMVLRVYSTDQWAPAVRYAVDNGAKVINHTQFAPFSGSIAALESALAYADSHGVLYVTPTSGRRENHDLLYPCNSLQPSVICVTSTNARGDADAGHAAKSVDIAAPGNNVFTTSGGGYAWHSGTSHAGPFVSGAAALIFSQKPGITHLQVKQILLSTVDPLPGYATDGPTPIVSGGRLNLARALSSSIGSPQGFPTKVTGPNYSDGQGWGVSPAYYETIQLADVNGDGKADVCARGNYGTECMLSTGTGFANWFLGPAWSDANGWATPDKYKTIQFADINGDGKADICGRAATGYECWLSNGMGFPTKVTGPNYSDGQGWGASPAYYETIQLADVNGDGKADSCARGNYGISCMLSTGTGFANFFYGPAWSDANGWATPDKYKTIRFADINGDGKADICGRAATGYECWLSDGTGFPTPLSGPTWSDVAAWILPQYYSTIKLSDVNGDLRRDVCARASLGYECWLAN